MFYECNYYIPEAAVWGLIALTAIPCMFVTHITKMSKKRTAAIAVPVRTAAIAARAAIRAAVTVVAADVAGNLIIDTFLLTFLYYS